MSLHSKTNKKKIYFSCVQNGHVSFGPKEKNKQLCADICLKSNIFILYYFSIIHFLFSKETY